MPTLPPLLGWCRLAARHLKVWVGLQRDDATFIEYLDKLNNNAQIKIGNKGVVVVEQDK